MMCVCERNTSLWLHTYTCTWVRAIHSACYSLHPFTFVRLCHCVFMSLPAVRLFNFTASPVCWGTFSTCLRKSVWVCMCLVCAEACGGQLAATGSELLLILLTCYRSQGSRKSSFSVWSARQWETQGREATVAAVYSSRLRNDECSFDQRKAGAKIHISELKVFEKTLNL